MFKVSGLGRARSAVFVMPPSYTAGFIIRKSCSNYKLHNTLNVIYLRKIASLLLFILLFIFAVSCRRYNTQQPAQVTTPTEHQRIEEVLLLVNQQLVDDDDMEIETFVEREGWQMQTTGSGLRYMIYVHGQGEKAVTGKVVTLDYTVSLLDSTVCYTSELLGFKKFRLGRGEVERGLEEGVLHMRMGDKARMILPPHLAHGLTGDGDCIPFRAIILYDVNLVGIE